MTRATGRLALGARILTVIAALLLGALYVTPLWSVRLVAPQYPEGIGMDIRVNTVTGVREHDLANINNLNHYIGMKEIHPDAIPELKYMPSILAGLIVFGVLAGVMGRRRVLGAWLATLVVAGAVGIADFWRWNHDYGHNLDYDRAIIVIPGMTYQPPLIGTKQIANFTATSFPNVGGALAGVAFLIGAGVFFAGRPRRTSLAQVASLALASACAAGPPMLAVGTATCVECRMLVTDARFGAVLVTKTGKQLTFDSVDCARDYQQHTQEHRDAALWVVDAASGRLLPEAQARFERDGSLTPPMGSTVTWASDVR